MWDHLVQLPCSGKVISEHMAQNCAAVATGTQTLTCTHPLKLSWSIKTNIFEESIHFVD